MTHRFDRHPFAPNYRCPEDNAPSDAKYTHAPGARVRQAGRVITVSSYMHRQMKMIPWQDLNGEHGYRGQDTYNLSKPMNILFTYELARRCAAASVTANALHPGWPLKTNLGREQHGAGGAVDRITKLVGSSAAKGARTWLYLASSAAVAGASGGHYARCKPATSSKLAHDEDNARKLWQLSAELCGTTYPSELEKRQYQDG